jgi:aminopeptidase-like protein
MTGLTVSLKVVLLYGQHCHDSFAEDTLDLIDLVIFLTEELEIISSRTNGLHYTIRFKPLAGTEIFRCKEEHKKGQSLNRDLGTKDGKHFTEECLVNQEAS